MSHIQAIQPNAVEMSRLIKLDANDPQDFDGLCKKIQSIFPNEATDLTPYALLAAGWRQQKMMRAGQTNNRAYLLPGCNTWLQCTPRVIAELQSMPPSKRQTLLGHASRVSPGCLCCCSFCCAGMHTYQHLQSWRMADAAAVPSAQQQQDTDC